MAELFFEDERMGIQDPRYSNKISNTPFSDLRYQDMGGVHPPLAHRGRGIQSIYHPMLDQPEDWRENIDINTLSTYPQPFIPPNMLDVSGRVGEYGDIPGEGFNEEMFYEAPNKGFSFPGILGALANKFRREPNPALEAELAALGRNEGYLDTGEFVSRYGDGKYDMWDSITTPEGTENIRILQGKNEPGKSWLGSETFDEAAQKKEDWVRNRLLKGKAVGGDILRWYRNRTGTSDRFTETGELIQTPRPDAGGAVTTGGGGGFNPVYDRTPPGVRPSWHGATAAREQAFRDTGGKSGQVAGPGFGQGAYWAQGGRVGYANGELVDEDINIQAPGFDVNENIEMASGGEEDILEQLVAKYVEAGFPPEQAQAMAMQELQQMVAQSGQGEGIASLV